MKTKHSFFVTSFLARASFCLLLFGIVSSGAFAQTGRVNLYKVTTPTLGWTDITSTGRINPNNSADGVVGIVPFTQNATTTLPFAFPYDNTTVASGTTLYISGAAISMGTAYTAEGISEGGLGTSSYPALLCTYAGERTGIGGRWWTNNGIYTQLTGTAPNRVFTIQLNNVHSACSPRDEGGGFSRMLDSSQTLRDDGRYPIHLSNSWLKYWWRLWYLL